GWLSWPRATACQKNVSGRWCLAITRRIANLRGLTMYEMNKNVTELQAELERERELFRIAVATGTDGSAHARRYEEIQRKLTAHPAEAA
ncbi:hypothetical protein, partial [Burkholderia cenocepacia]|uniref:hypothetical protein n=2 Tax=Burkholderiaceae TaxID=119060 RepID=UPI002861A646